MTDRLSRPATTVPFFDLSATHEPLRDELLDEVAALLESGAFTNGPHVAEFEEAFARYCGVEHCVGVGSGLDALRLGLQALGVGEGDEVIVPAHTFIATWEAVSQTGATPVPVDVTEADWNIDVDAATAAIGTRTAALLPVHLYGQMADVRALTARCGDVPIVEDAAQAHGATRDGVIAGATSAVAGFSFYPAKNLGAIGDAGAAVTGDAELARRLRALREHGQEQKYHHGVVGWTARLDTIQAAALLLKLPHLGGWNESRRALAAAYGERLAGVGDLVLPPVAPGSEPVWHLYVVRTADPEALAAWLREHGVGTGRHYPEPPHLSAAYRELGLARGAFPVAEAIAREALSLPIFPGMTDEQLEHVVGETRRYFDGG